MMPARPPVYMIADEPAERKYMWSELAHQEYSTRFQWARVSVRQNWEYKGTWFEGGRFYHHFKHKAPEAPGATTTSVPASEAWEPKDGITRVDEDANPRGES